VFSPVILYMLYKSWVYLPQRTLCSLSKAFWPPNCSTTKTELGLYTDVNSNHKLWDYGQVQYFHFSQLLSQAPLKRLFLTLSDTWLLLLFLFFLLKEQEGSGPLLKLN
jgi:hypothetical protein